MTSDPVIAANLHELYGDVDQIDAWIGGLAEDPAEGGMLGETFSVVIIDQFTRLRDGDPYWSEAGQFTEEKLDALWATTLSDVILANTDIDTLQDSALIAATRIGGTAEDDVLSGTDGADLLICDDGNDQLNGDAGSDQLEGGDGADLLSGGTGNDVLYGGSGADSFIFGLESGHDVIADFGPNDTLVFEDDIVFAEIDIAQVGHDSVLTFGMDSSVTVVETSSEHLDDAFTFV